LKKKNSGIDSFSGNQIYFLILFYIDDCSVVVVSRCSHGEIIFFFFDFLFLALRANVIFTFTRLLSTVSFSRRMDGRAGEILTATRLIPTRESASYFFSFSPQQLFLFRLGDCFLHFFLFLFFWEEGVNELSF
jgi:hypothetical protein